jgi:hypothetical protein
MTDDVSAAPDAATPNAGEICIDASQLRPGVHVRLPVPWIDHQFMFNSFVIADEEQARLIAAMKLPQLFCDPARCKVAPLPQRAADAPAGRAGEAEKGAAGSPDRGTHGREARACTGHERTQGAPRQGTATLHQRRPGSGWRHPGFSVHPREAVERVARVSEDTDHGAARRPRQRDRADCRKGARRRHAAHSLSVMTLALLLGKQAKLPEQALRALGIGALLHDIGKLAIKPSILRNSERNRHEEVIYQIALPRRPCRGAARRQPVAAPARRHPAPSRALRRQRFPGPPERQRDSRCRRGWWRLPTASTTSSARSTRGARCRPPRPCRRCGRASRRLRRNLCCNSSCAPWASIPRLDRPAQRRPHRRGRRLGARRQAALAEGHDLRARGTASPVDHHRSGERRRAQDRAPLRLQERPAEELDYLLPRRKINWSYMAEAEVICGPGDWPCAMLTVADLSKRHAGASRPLFSGLALPSRPAKSSPWSANRASARAPC